jgi:hypothetical protein
MKIRSLVSSILNLVTWLVIVTEIAHMRVQKKMFQMGEMGEVALENGWAFFTSQRCDEVAEKSV